MACQTNKFIPMLFFCIFFFSHKKKSKWVAPQIAAIGYPRLAAPIAGAAYHCSRGLTRERRLLRPILLCGSELPLAIFETGRSLPQIEIGRSLPEMYRTPQGCNSHASS